MTSHVLTGQSIFLTDGVKRDGDLVELDCRLLVWLLFLEKGPTGRFNARLRILTSISFSLWEVFSACRFNLHDHNLLNTYFYFICPKLKQAKLIFLSPPPSLINPNFPIQ